MRTLFYGIVCLCLIVCENSLYDLLCNQADNHTIITEYLPGEKMHTKQFTMQWQQKKWLKWQQDARLSIQGISPHHRNCRINITSENMEQMHITDRSKRIGQSPVHTGKGLRRSGPGAVMQCTDSYANVFSTH